MKLKEIIESLHKQGYTSERIADRLFKPVATIRRYLPAVSNEFDTDLFLKRVATAPVDALVAQFGKTEAQLRRIAKTHGVKLLRRKRDPKPLIEKKAARVDQISPLALAGNSQVDIAHALGISEITVARYRRQHGIELAKRSPPVSKLTMLLNDKDLKTELKNAGSYNRLAIQLGVAHSAVRAYCLKHGVRSPHKKGKVQYQANNKVELVATLANKGLSPAEIATQTGLSKATVYEYISRAKGKRKPLWKKPPGYKPKPKE
jgi:DNA-binding NarL/FixJ family response regulator